MYPARRNGHLSNVLIFFQHRYISIGGRASRAGSGGKHTKMSVKQVSSIPKGPGKAGRADNTKQTSRFFVPLSRLTQPQVLNRSISGKWVALDCSFSDLVGVDDPYPTELNEFTREKRYSNEEIKTSERHEAAQLFLTLCKELLLLPGDGRITTPYGGELNSGPQYEYLEQRSKKRRMWFAVVKNYYAFSRLFWGCGPTDLETNDSSFTPLNLETQFQLLSYLSAVNNCAVFTPASWENEPSECYKPLDLTVPVRGLIREMKTNPQECELLLTQGGKEGLDRILRCASYVVDYDYLFEAAPIFNDRDSQVDTLWRLMKLLSETPNLTMKHGIGFLRVILQGNSNSNQDFDQLRLEPILRFSATNTHGELKEVDEYKMKLITKFINTIIHPLNSQPFETFTHESYYVLMKALTAIHHGNQSFYNEIYLGSVNDNKYNNILDVKSLALTTIRRVNRILKTGNILERQVFSEDQQPIQEDHQLRLAHPDIHPNEKLRLMYPEGIRTLSVSKYWSSVLLSGMNEMSSELWGTCDHNSELAIILQQTATSGVEKGKSSNIKSQLRLLVASLRELRFRRSGATNASTPSRSANMARNRLNNLLAAVDHSLPSARDFEDPEDVVVLLETFAECSHKPVNFIIIEGVILKHLSSSTMSVKQLSRLATSLAVMGISKPVLFQLITNAVLRKVSDCKTDEEMNILVPHIVIFIDSCFQCQTPLTACLICLKFHSLDTFHQSSNNFNDILRSSSDAEITTRLTYAQVLCAWIGADTQGVSAVMRKGAIDTATKHLIIVQDSISEGMDLPLFVSTITTAATLLELSGFDKVLANSLSQSISSNVVSVTNESHVNNAELSQAAASIASIVASLLTESSNNIKSLKDAVNPVVSVIHTRVKSNRDCLLNNLKMMQAGQVGKETFAGALECGNLLCATLKLNAFFPDKLQSVCIDCSVALFLFIDFICGSEDLLMSPMVADVISIGDTVKAELDSCGLWNSTEAEFNAITDDMSVSNSSNSNKASTEHIPQII